MFKSLRKSQLPEKRENQKLQIMIAILFSIVTIVSGFSRIIYVPIEGADMLDITIVAFVFAVLIGGYSVGIPLAIVWSLVTWFNMPQEFREWDLWQMIFTREIFAISLVFFYCLAKRTHERSPLNVYRAIIAGVVTKCIVALPFDLIVDSSFNSLKIRGEIMLLEIALCSVFMALLIKHLREVHILNGVKKREKGEKRNASKTNVS